MHRPVKTNDDEKFSNMCVSVTLIDLAKKIK